MAANNLNIGVGFQDICVTHGGKLANPDALKVL